MTPNEVKSIILKEIKNNYNLSNNNSVDLKKCLVSPTLRFYQDSFNDNTIVSLWLVLEEDLITKKGYKIVFNEKTESFGLAIPGHGGADFLVGYYGSFLETLKAM